MGCLQQIITPANPCLNSTPCEQYTSSDCVLFNGTLSCVTGPNPTLTAALAQICSILQANQIMTVTVAISSAQILNSFTSPVTLLPAPGGGFQWNVISVQGYYTYSGTPYTAVSTIGILQGDIGNLLDLAAGTFTYLLTAANASSSFKDTLGNGAIASSNGSNFYNMPVQFYTQTANPQAGTGTLLLTITAIKTN